MGDDQLSDRLDEIQATNNWSDEDLYKMLWNWMMEQDELLDLFVKHLEGLSKDSE